MHLTPRYIAIANPESKRWQLYSQELLSFWRERNTQPIVEVIPWIDVVQRQGILDRLAAFDESAIVRIESPGKNFEVTKAMLQIGARGEQSDTDWLSLPYRKGDILRPRLYHQGFCQVLDGLRQSFDARPHLTLTAQPLEIAEQFDKRATSVRLHNAGIPTPPWLPTVENATELLSELRRQKIPNAYVKLNTGSSAMGIAVVHMPILSERRSEKSEPWALSTMVRLDGGYFNSRRLWRCTGADLNNVLQFLLSEDAFVQRGVRMAEIDGQNFDVRVVVIHGRPEFTIFRLSSHPVTNLYFGGRRGNVGDCKRHIPKRAWLDAIDHCVEAARLYRAAVVGIDLLFERGWMRHYILEVNAFGDFFPGWTDERGRTVHRAEIEATAKLSEQGDSSAG